MKMQRLVLATVSRAIWNNDRRLAKSICRTSSIANDLLIVVGARVLCRNFILFDEMFNEAHHKVHQKSRHRFLAQGTEDDSDVHLTLPESNPHCCALKEGKEDGGTHWEI